MKPCTLSKADQFYHRPGRDSLWGLVWSFNVVKNGPMDRYCFYLVVFGFYVSQLFCAYFVGMSMDADDALCVIRQL